MADRPLAPDDIRFTRVISTARRAYDNHPERHEHSARYELREGMAKFIADRKIETIMDDYYVGHRLELYVASPAEFWEVVQREAEQVALRYGIRAVGA